MTRLHPEGAPGQAEAHMRALLGDAEYERRQELADEANGWARAREARAARRADRVDNLLGMAGGLALVVFVVALAVAPAVVVAVWRWL